MKIRKPSSAVLANKPLPPLRIKEAAKQASVSAGTIYNWMDEQRFKHWRVCPPGKNRGLTFIDRASFEAFLASMQEGVGA